MPYHSTLQLPSRENECKEIISLDGQWRFKWSRNPDERPAGFEQTDYDISQWDTISVPGNWQTQNFGKPIYTNITYPFKRDRPYVTSEPPADWYAYDHRNPVGSYVTFINVSAEMLRKNLILHFGGVKSAMYVWVNGHPAGYSQNSMSPAEFNITDLVKEGENRLAVEVYRWSDGSYLEDQDMWRFSGIFRPVRLWVRPLAHIADYAVTPVLNQDLDKATVNARITLCNTGKKKTRHMRARFSIDGRTIDSAPLDIAAGDTTDVTLSCTFERPILWSAETPHLYPFSIELLDSKGAVTEHFDYHTGIKKTETAGEVFKINGKNVKLRGINRHEHHPRTGRYVDNATVELDIKLMKQCNINFLRTSHYPDSPYLYELCDRYGLYVMDEANQESHGYGYANTEMGEDPLWERAHVDRAVSLVQRDKNHPCITLWSLGNEGGIGPNIQAMYDTITSLDPTRLPFYDCHPRYSALHDEGYPTPAMMQESARKVTDKPYIAREYAHAMGNSMGNFQEYWDVIYADSTIAGAAIWDWVDQGLAKPIDGSPLRPSASLSLANDEFWAYGGDFGDKPNDKNFLINGLIAPDRRPHPHYYEVQYVYQPIHFRMTDSGNILLINRDCFTPLTHYRYEYELLRDGDVIQKGDLSLNGDRLDIPQHPHDGEIMLNVYACLPEATQWAEAGFRIAHEQFGLTAYNIPGMPETHKGTPGFKHTANGITVTTGRGIISISRDGAITDWTQDGEKMLLAPLEPYFWKPANDNQNASDYAVRMGAWRDAAGNREARSFDTDTVGGRLRITCRTELPTGADYTLRYTIDNDSHIQVDADYTPLKNSIPSIPKFGMRMRLPANFNQVEYYGRGPWENYPDRKRAATIGRYRMPLRDFMTEYIKPQDNGNRCDVRDFTLSSESHRLNIKGLQPLCIRAWDYGEEDLTAGHPHEIQRGKFVNLNIDLNIHGVGGADTWGKRTLEQYTIDGNKPYHYSFILSFRQP